MKNVETSVLVRVASDVISGTALVLLLGWGVASTYMTMNKSKIKKFLQDSKQKTK